jgi:hypothetical protein
LWFIISVMYTDKKVNKIFLVYKEIQGGAVVKSYSRVQRSSVVSALGWAAVRQPRVRIPPGTPPSAQQDELFTQTQEFIPSSGRYPAGEDQPEDEY